MTKICTSCNEAKDLSAFGVRKDTLAHKCKACTAVADNERRAIRNDPAAKATRQAVKDWIRDLKKHDKPLARICNRCGEEKDILEFRDMSSIRPGYYNPKCRECENIINRTYFADHRDRINRNTLKYKTSARGKQTRAIWIANNKQKLKYARRKHHLRKTFGLTPHEFEQLKAKQFNKCAICNCGPEPRPRGGGMAYELYIDHNHTTGAVRGLLCHSCNAVLGLAEENSLILINAIRYIAGNGLEVSEHYTSMRKDKGDISDDDQGIAQSNENLATKARA